MELFIDEDEQRHIYSCLLVGNGEFQKVRKSLAKLNREDGEIDDEIDRNAKLRKIFNPRAEEEARERDRAKADPAQLDIEGATETGGSTKTRITTPPAQTDEQLRDALYDIGLVVALTSIRGWLRDERDGVSTWLGQVVAANTIGGIVPDEPTPLALYSIPKAIVDERVGMGPYTVIDRSKDDGPCFDIEHTATHEVKESLVDPIDAAYFAAQFNIERLRNSDITPDEIHRWSGAGPWLVVSESDGDSERYFIVAGAQREKYDAIEDAFAAAARYNRSIAQRGWTEPPPPHVDDDAVQEIAAAKEAVGDVVDDAPVAELPPRSKRSRGGLSVQ